MTNFIESFKIFCQEKYHKDNSGTAVSYVNAIKYLLDFLDAENVDDKLILEIKSIEMDIRDVNGALYNELKSFLTYRRQSSSLEKGFISAALPILYEFCLESSPMISTATISSELVLLNELKDTQIVSNFNIDKIKGQLSFSQIVEHNYSVRKINGTSSEAAKKIISGRKAEKYFISYLASLGFVENIDYIDVANNKNFGFDLRFLETALEIKNIKSGSFFLSDNEIARLEISETHLILIDIDNGIWVLSPKSEWLKNAIREIKEIREYCKSNYPNLDLSGIRINIDKKIKDDILEISKYSKNDVILLFSK